jgi:hypothetical protein
MTNEADDGPEQVAVLADELFRAVELHQGYFFVSDGEMFPTPAEFFERVRGRLKHGRRAVRKMHAFLKKHGEA